MQTFLMVIRLAALVGGIYGGVVLLRKLSPSLDGWKRATAAFFCGLVVFSITCTITRTDAERKQEADWIEAQKKQEQAQAQEKQEKAEKAEKARIAEKKAAEQAQKKAEEKQRPKLKAKDIAEAKDAVARFIDEDVFQKVDVISDDKGLVDVWTGSKFAAIPYDWKKNALAFVYVAYCNKTMNGYIHINDGYTGKKVGTYTLRSELELD
jgi:hypothetical protein